MIEGAGAVIVHLNGYKRSWTAYPFQQDEVTAAINRCAKNAVKKSKRQSSHQDHPTRVQTWQYMLTAKYNGMKDTRGSAIAYGGYILGKGGGTARTSMPTYLPNWGG